MTHSFDGFDDDIGAPLSDFDDTLLTIFDGIDLKNSDFVDSLRLQTKLKLIMQSVFEKAFAKRGIEQNIKARLEVLIMKLSGTVLCFPAITSILGMGTAASTIFESFDKVLTPSLKGGRHKMKELKNDAVLSVLIDILRLAYQTEIAMMKSTSDMECDSQRAALVAKIIQVRSSPIIPTSVTIEDYYGEVISLMTCHLLSVRALSKEIATAIEVNTKALRDEVRAGATSEIDGPAAKGYMDATERAAMHFFAWVRGNEMSLSRASRSSEIVSSVDPSVRAWLKAEEYGSARELVSVYEQKYRSFLTNMDIPLQAFTNADVTQAFKDIHRESVVLNGDDMKGAEFTQEGIKSVLRDASIFGSDTREKGGDTNNESPVRLDSNNNQSASQLLQIYVMLAASRTIAGGDSFCIIEDLFGGDGLVLCPFREKSDGKKHGTGISSPGLQVDVYAQELRITLREAFGLYASDCIGSPRSALIHFRCSTVTAIRLPLERDDLISKPHEVIKRNVTVVPMLLSV